MNSLGLHQSSKYVSLKKWALLIGLIGIFVAGIGFVQGLIHADSRPIFSWLIGLSAWLAISVGLLFLVMLFHIFDAGWPIVVRRQIEHAIGFFPYLGLLVLPLLALGWFYKHPGIIWTWIDTAAQLPGEHVLIGEDPLYLHKAGYLNLPFFTLRMVGYFTLLSFFAHKLRKHSFAMDVSGDKRHVVANRFYSGMGIPLVALTATFAAFDLYMSLSYHWFSTIYGVWFFATGMRAALAITVLGCAILSTKGYLKTLFKPGHLYNLGCLFLAFTVFWAYICFSQYFLIYNANIPEETFWYQMRELTVGGEGNATWWWVGLCLVFGYFFFPFLYMLFYKSKVLLGRMVFISIWILIFFCIDLYFNILPVKIAVENAFGYEVRQFSVTLWDVSAILGVGGLFIWAFLRSLPKAEPIPIRDPRIQESLDYHE